MSAKMSAKMTPLSDYSKEELLKMAMRHRTDPGIVMSMAEAKDYWFRLGFMQGLSAGTKLSLITQEDNGDDKKVKN